MPSCPYVPFDPVAPFPSPSAPGVLARMAERWRQHRRRNRWVREMANVASLGRLDDVLCDVALTRSELGSLINGRPDAGSQFEKLARMENVDLSRERPETLREAMWNCARCPCRAPCDHWLRTGEWTGDGDTRCPNAALLRR